MLHDFPLNRGTYNVIYHYLLSGEQIVAIDRCSTERYPNYCEEAAIHLYLRRMKEIEAKAIDPCSEKDSLPHFGHTRLKKEYTSFVSRVCPTK